MTWPLSFATETITCLRAPLVTDVYGNQVFDWDDAVEVDVAECTVQPAPAPEANEGKSRDAVTRRWFVAGPPGADIIATDRVRRAGVVYEVDGAPLQYTTGVADHCELWLADVRG